MDFNTLQVTSEKIIKRRPFTYFNKFTLNIQVFMGDLEKLSLY
jgi:hypothetical protein